MSSHIYIIEDNPKNIKLFKKILGLVYPQRVSYYDSILRDGNTALIPWAEVLDPKMIVYSSSDGNIGLDLLTSKKLFLYRSDQKTEVNLRKPDLVVLDIQLPGISGVDICSKLRQERRFKKIPIIAITAYAQPEDERIIMSAGFTHYLTKPFKKEDFLRIIKTRLRLI